MEGEERRKEDLPGEKESKAEEKVETIPIGSPLHVSPSLKSLLRCFYGLNQLEVEIFMYLLKNGPKKVKVLAQKFDRDYSVVYRALKTLCELGIVEKKSQREGIGRPYHLYKTIEEHLLKDKLNEIAKTWQERVHEVLHNIQ
ncbi:MAG: hypothetical protein GWO20_16560 [Candidatus Korarchaeota archaeon]|nr:hypothetical protein [Candidatus Korarchaeota archaeon]NIU85017.1 hypothetical protein [Candidatus Thorarchaeota archaeon]NIW15042.1 hypothetical protein [Candidatus Thorarchaeota archaeon]NIW53052.1 hypothetical protein [Candidatus Korarchaeota archaeon]